MIISKFSMREKAMAIGTSTIIITALIYAFIAEPVMRTHSRLNRQISSGLMKLEKSYRLIRSEEAILAKYSRYAELIKPMPSEEEEIAAMLKAIEEIARSNSIYITNIRPQPVRDKEAYSEVVFELSAEAGLERLIKFIYDMQRSGNLLRVTRLTLTAGGSKESLLRTVMEISKPYILEFD